VPTLRLPVALAIEPPLDIVNAVPDVLADAEPYRTFATTTPAVDRRQRHREVRGQL
jgi:hypothetical protein